MDSVSVAKKHQKIRDAAIAKQIKESLAYLNREDLKQGLLTVILHSYQPKTEEINEEITNELTKTFNRKIEELTITKLEELINDNLTKIFDDKLEKKIVEMVDEELDRRFEGLIKYHEEY